MSEESAVLLLDIQSGSFVEAVFYDSVDIKYAQKADASWGAFLEGQKDSAEFAGRSVPAIEHEHWKWEAKVERSGHLLSMPTMAIECQGEPQGMISLLTDGKTCQLPGHEGKSLVYVMYLATAPWNLPQFGTRLRGAGEVLMKAAVQMSLDLGFKGRVGLHALPKSEGFYRKCVGMTEVGPDPQTEDLVYYELDEEAANSFMEEKP